MLRAPSGVPQTTESGIASHSDMKRNGIGSFVVMWMKLESVTQSEVNQKEKKKYILMQVCEI